MRRALLSSAAHKTTKKNFQKNREESLHCLLWLSQKTEQEKQKENSMALERKRRRKVCKVTWREKEDFRKGKSSKGDLYFGKGVASAWT